MFASPKYVRNSFGVSFQRQLTVRRNANEFEDILKEHYFQPQIISVPDDLDPEVPRIIFGSQHGFSQIVVSQINVTLNVKYSPDWQKDISKGRQYLLERIPILFKLLKVLEEARPYFCGLVTLVRLPAEVDESIVLNSISSLSHDKADNRNLHDIYLKTTTVSSDRFFSNITMKNYRLWKTETDQQSLPRLSRKKATENGIEIISDFNDRYRFNEDRNYFSSEDIVEKIIDGAFSEIYAAIEKVRDLRP